MRSCRLPVWGCRATLLLVALLAMPLAAQEPAPETKAPQSQPAIPQAYRLDIHNVLAYQVVSTTKIGMAQPVTMKYREMVVFDIDDGGNLVVYIGAPDTKALAAQNGPVGMEAPRGERRGLARPTDQKPAGAEEGEKVQMTWTRHVLGKNFTRNDDGTISFRPRDGEAMPYPVLPLPPAQAKEKEKFDLVVPDLALGEGKTVQVTGQCKVQADGKMTVDARLEARITPGVMPELATIGYDVPPGAAGVSAVRMTRKQAPEMPAREGEEAGGDGARRPQPAPRPAAAQAQQPIKSILMQLVSSKPVADDVRRELVQAIHGPAHGEGHGEAHGEPAGDTGGDGDKPAAPQVNSAKVPSNLWGQVEQIDAAKEKTQETAK